MVTIKCPTCENSVLVEDAHLNHVGVWLKCGGCENVFHIKQPDPEVSTSQGFGNSEKLYVAPLLFEMTEKEAEKKSSAFKGLRIRGLGKSDLDVPVNGTDQPEEPLEEPLNESIEDWETLETKELENMTVSDEFNEALEEYEKNLLMESASESISTPDHSEDISEDFADGFLDDFTDELTFKTSFDQEYSDSEKENILEFEEKMREKAIEEYEKSTPPISQFHAEEKEEEKELTNSVPSDAPIQMRYNLRSFKRADDEVKMDEIDLGLAFVTPVSGISKNKKTSKPKVEKPFKKVASILQAPSATSASSASSAPFEEELRFAPVPEVREFKKEAKKENWVDLESPQSKLPLKDIPISQASYENVNENKVNKDIEKTKSSTFNLRKIENTMAFIVGKGIQVTVAVLIFGTSFMIAHFLSDSLDSEYQEYAINTPTQPMISSGNDESLNSSETLAESLETTSEESIQDQLSIAVSGIKKMQDSTAATVAIYEGNEEDQGAEPYEKQPAKVNPIKAKLEQVEDNSMSDLRGRSSIKLEDSQNSRLHKKNKNNALLIKKKKNTYNKKVKLSKNVEVLASEMIIYSGPFDNSESIGVVNKGRKLKVLGRFRNWIWVKDKKLGRGWVHSEMMKVRKL